MRASFDHSVIILSTYVGSNGVSDFVDVAQLDYAAQRNSPDLHHFVLAHRDARLRDDGVAAAAGDGARVRVLLILHRCGVPRIVPRVGLAATGMSGGVTTTR